MAQSTYNPPWFVRKDLDGFFGLMIDILIQLILIVSLEIDTADRQSYMLSSELKDSDIF